MRRRLQGLPGCAAPMASRSASIRSASCSASRCAAASCWRMKRSARALIGGHVGERTAPYFITTLAAFIVLAVAGGYLTSHKMNRTADEQAMSAGRPGDAMPNGLQEFQNDKAARGPPPRGRIRIALYHPLPVRRRRTMARNKPTGDNKAGQDRRQVHCR